MKNPHKPATIEHWDFEDARREAAFAVYDETATIPRDRTNRRRNGHSRHIRCQHFRAVAAYRSANKAGWVSEKPTP